MIKYYLVVILILITNTFSFAQNEINENEMKSSQINSSLKSENQRNAGWIMLTIGSASIIGGSIWANSEFESKGIFNADFETQALLIIVGAVAVGISIPLFISARRNKIKEKSASAYFKLETIDQHYVYRNQANYPAFSLNITF